MIIPAVVYKILGFKNKIGDKEFSLVPEEGKNVVLIQLDDGTLNEVSFYGNNKDYNSLYSYLESKTEQGIKKDKIGSYVADLATTENKKLLALIDKETNETGGTKKEILESVSKAIIKDKIMIKSGSMIRTALAFTTDENGFNSKFNSRSIISFEDKGEVRYSTTGVYSQAILANQIPIEISPIKKSDGAFIGYFRVQTGEIISKQHVISILRHSIRTIENAIATSSNALIPKIIQQINGNSELNVLKNKINENKRKYDDMKKNAQPFEYSEYQVLVDDLKKFATLLMQDMTNLKKFKMELPIIIPQDDFAKKTILHTLVHGEKRPEDLSPFRMFPDAAIMLNFSKEDPTIKAQAKDYISNTFLKQIANGNYSPRLLLNYNLPKGDILDNSDSWGYMGNNIDFSKLSLSFADAKNIILQTEKYIDEIKNG